MNMLWLIMIILAISIVALFALYTRYSKPTTYRLDDLSHLCDHLFSYRLPPASMVILSCTSNAWEIIVKVTRNPSASELLVEVAIPKSLQDVLENALELSSEARPLFRMSDSMVNEIHLLGQFSAVDVAGNALGRLLTQVIPELDSDERFFCDANGDPNVPKLRQEFKKAFANRSRK